ncbi:MAG: hypothetical protein HY816_03545 [Candidatus Wallbacteria bacterium]|nr:hypothetical protein [Candidatus Wallbacteria bacterium]
MSKPALSSGLWLALVLLAFPAAATGQPSRLESFATRASLTAMRATTGGLYFVLLGGGSGPAAAAAPGVRLSMTAALLRWKPGLEAPVLVERQLGGTRFRVRDSQLLYALGPGALVSRDPGAETTRELPLAGVSARSLRFAFPDGDTYLLTGRLAADSQPDAPAIPILYTSSMREASPMPLPTGSASPVVHEVLGPTEALAGCEERLLISTFAGPLRHALPLAKHPAGYWPLEPPVPFEVGEDSYLSGILALARGGTGPGFELVRVGPPSWKLPPGDRITAVFQRSEDDVLMVQHRTGDGLWTDWVARPREGRQTSSPAAGQATGAAIYWAARELLLWREGPWVVAFDCRHLRPLGRAEIAGGISIVPGAAAGERLLVAAGAGDGCDLYWLGVDSAGALSLAPAAKGLPGRPIAFFSEPGNGACYVVLERADGPGLDLIGFKGATR